MYHFKIIFYMSIFVFILGCGKDWKSTPDLLGEKTIIEKEPLAYTQWHISTDKQFRSTYDISDDADINISYAWNYVLGRDVKIAIIDDNFDLSHKDLENSAFATFDMTNNTTSLSKNINKISHGTAVAGIVTANINSYGMVGIAPESKIIYIKVDNNTSSEMMIRALNKAREYSPDIYLNLWGSYSVTDELKTLLQNIATTDRDNKGAVVIFASGNKGINLDDKNISDESELDYVLGVGAIGKDGLVSTYSNYGSNLDVVAPGGDKSFFVATIDDVGDDGFSTSSNSDEEDFIFPFLDLDVPFYGTSVSAPIVAGVVALVLEANGNLKANEIIEILQNSADKIGPEIYTNGKNSKYGYGRVNAGRAVKMALEKN